MTLRIAIVDNLSAYAYRLIPPSFRATLRYGTPAQIETWVALGETDAALLPSACLPEHRKSMEYAGAYGIACEGRVSSVLLFSKQPVARLVQTRQTIHVPAKSRTSRALLSVLCSEQYSQRPRIAEESECAAARLLMGNEAADSSREEQGWPVVQDLGQWWYTLTGQPFVYARWVMRRGLSRELQRALTVWLESCANAAATPRGHMHLARMAAAQNCLGGDLGWARAYYARLRLRLTLRDLQGLQTFLSLLGKDRACARTA